MLTAGDDGADGWGGLPGNMALMTLAGTGDVEAVADEVAAGAFDGAGGDGPAGFERGVVVELVKVT